MTMPNSSLARTTFFSQPRALHVRGTLSLRVCFVSDRLTALMHGLTLPTPLLSAPFSSVSVVRATTSLAAHKRSSPCRSHLATPIAFRCSPLGGHPRIDFHALPRKVFARLCGCAVLRRRFRAVISTSLFSRHARFSIHLAGFWPNDHLP